MICDRKCIYIHQPKTGGNTVANIIQDIVSDSSRVMGMHYTMREFLHFDNLSDDLMLFANRMGFYPNTIPKLNTKKDSVYSNMERIIINDPIFQKLIAKACKREIEYFGYTIPTFNNLEISNKFIY